MKPKREEANKMSKNRRPEECGLFPIVKLAKIEQADEPKEVHPVVFACKYVLVTLLEAFVTVVQLVLMQIAVFLFLFAPVALGLFIKYLGFFN